MVEDSWSWDCLVEEYNAGGALCGTSFDSLTFEEHLSILWPPLEQLCFGRSYLSPAGKRRESEHFQKDCFPLQEGVRHMVVISMLLMLYDDFQQTQGANRLQPFGWTFNLLNYDIYETTEITVL